MLVPALAGLAGYLMSNPRRRKHRRRNPATAKDVRRLQLLENEYIVAKNRYENRRPGDDAAKLKRAMTEARIRHRFFWGHAADEPRGYVFRARRNPYSLVVGRAKYDASLPWNKDDAKIVKRVKRSWGLGGVIFYPKTDEQEFTLHRIFKTERQNPKRRKVKVRRKVKGKWKTVTTIIKTVRRVKTNPQDFWWYPHTREERHHRWSARGSHSPILSPTKPHPDKPGIRWRRSKRTERMIGLPDTNRQNPSTPLRDASRLIDNNHYYVSDKEAGALTRQYGKGTLPGTGYDQILHTPEGKFWLSRTEVRYHARFKKKRGWVWCIYPTAS